jgi:hypothetical protein
VTRLLREAPRTKRQVLSPLGAPSRHLQADAPIGFPAISSGPRFLNPQSAGQCSELLAGRS